MGDLLIPSMARIDWLKRLVFYGCFCSLVFVPRSFSQSVTAESAAQRATSGKLTGDERAGGDEGVVQHFRAAQDDMRAGRFDDAIEQFKKVLQLQPDLVEARVNLGLAYHAAGDYTQAVGELSKAAASRSDIVPASLFLGLSYLKLGSPERAISPLDHVLALDSSNREARRALGAAELAVGNYGKAQSQFRWLFAAQPDKAEAWFTLGRSELQMAKRLTTQLTVQFPDSAWSLRLAGDVLGERNLWNDAALAYRKALLATPREAGLHAALGKSLLRAGKEQEAESEFNAELSRNPFEPAALIGLAEVQLQRGNAQSALESITKIWKMAPEALAYESAFPAVELAPSSARQMVVELKKVPPSPAQEFLISALSTAAGDAACADEARSNFEASVRSRTAPDPQQDSASRSSCEQHEERLCEAFLGSQNRLGSTDLLRLGEARFTLGEDEAAADAFAAALGENKADAEAMYWLGRADLRLADTCFDQLTAAYPDFWRAHELRAEAFGIRQANKEAIAEFRAAAELHPDDAEIHESLGDLLLHENALGEAERELRAALALDPSAARSLYLLGQLNVNERKYGDAIPYLERALHYDPSLLEARPALGKAYLKVGKPALAVPELEQSSKADRYGDLHYLLYQAYHDEGKPALAAQALARSQELRRKSAADDRAKIRPAEEE